MQVADIQGAATAATLGAQKTTAMGMVEDASFLMMLSTNLYSNQQLACIRETLCNAWDAHIEAGTTNVPVKITITEENELIIEDSGLGIPDDRFEQIYGTFGGSTKRQNKAVTGGFGLGCKSPWAYAESFRVISENQGKKVIYNLVKASVEAEGLPAITRVLETATDRTGLTVRFQLQESDVRQMRHYIEAVACHGDMLVDLHHMGRKEAVTNEEIGVERLRTINLDPTPGSYDVSDSWYHHYMGNHQLFVRYGAVIYPMLQTPGTQKAVDLLRQFMEIVGFKRMVVQAAPGTLALTPNRETLSSSKMTENGITDLCVALVARIEDDIIKQIPASILQAAERLAKGDQFHTSLEHYASLSDAITPVPVRRYLSSQLGMAKYAKYLAMLKAAEHRGFKNAHVFQKKSSTHEFHKLRRRMVGKHWKDRDAVKFAFLKHHVLRPVSRVFQKHAELLKLSEFHCSEHFYHGNSNRHPSLLVDLDLDNFAHMQQLLDTPTVFITSRIKRFKDTLDCCPWITHGAASWTYRIVPNDVRKPAIIKAFEDAGMKVIDITLNHDWDDVAAELEEEKLRRAATRRARSGQLDLPVGLKKTPNALMSLCNVYDEAGRRKMGHDRIKLMKSDLETTDTPLFFVPLESVSSGSLGRFGSYLDLTDEERKLGVVVRTGTEKNMAIKRGAVHVDKFLARRLWDRVQSKEYQTYRTKQCRSAVFDDHHIDPDLVTLLDYLGIKLAGFDKLRDDPDMDRVTDRIKSLTGNDFMWTIENLPTEQLQHYSNVQGSMLEELPCVKKLKALKDDWMLSGLLSNVSHPLDRIKESPERHAALKSLVMSVFKNGN
jgi:hypothetical protein